MKYQAVVISFAGSGAPPEDPTHVVNQAIFNRKDILTVCFAGCQDSAVAGYGWTPPEFKRKDNPSHSYFYKAKAGVTSAVHAAQKGFRFAFPNLNRAGTNLVQSLDIHEGSDVHALDLLTLHQKFGDAVQVYSAGKLLDFNDKQTIEELSKEKAQFNRLFLHGYSRGGASIAYVAKNISDKIKAAKSSLNMNLYAYFPVASNPLSLRNKTHLPDLSDTPLLSGRVYLAANGIYGGIDNLFVTQSHIPSKGQLQVSGLPAGNHWSDDWLTYAHDLSSYELLCQLCESNPDDETLRNQRDEARKHLSSVIQNSSSIKLGFDLSTAFENIHGLDKKDFSMTNTLMSDLYQQADFPGKELEKPEDHQLDFLIAVRSINESNLESAQKNQLLTLLTGNSDESAQLKAALWTMNRAFSTLYADISSIYDSKKYLRDPSLSEVPLQEVLGRLKNYRDKMLQVVHGHLNHELTTDEMKKELKDIRKSCIKDVLDNFGGNLDGRVIRTVMKAFRFIAKCLLLIPKQLAKLIPREAKTMEEQLQPPSETRKHFTKDKEFKSLIHEVEKTLPHKRGNHP